MSSVLEKTSVPGIYRRHVSGCPRGRCECNYVVVWRDRGRQRSETFRTFTEAKEGKRVREAQVSRGHSTEYRKILLRDYALEWIESYAGTGKRGYRETTRDSDRKTLKKYALKYFPARTYLVEVTPKDITNFIAWLTKQPAKPKSKAEKRSGKPVKAISDATVKNALKPLRACFGTARREGLIQINPTTDAVLPHREQITDDEDLERPFPGKTMELVVELINPKYRLMFKVLAATGLRRSELLALEWRHLELDGSYPHIKVRQAVLKQDGVGLKLFPPKTKNARREVPIPLALADELRSLRDAPTVPVFPSRVGTWLNPDNLYGRVLKPAMLEAGIDKGGFHTFRHTVASRLFANGRNVVQVQHFLGHSDPGFTLKTYIHLLDNDLGGPLEPVQDNTKTTGGTKTDENRVASELVKSEV